MKFKAIICKNCLEFIAEESKHECRVEHMVEGVVELPQDWCLIERKKDGVLCVNTNSGEFVVWSLGAERNGNFTVCWGHYYRDLESAFEYYKKKVA